MNARLLGCWILALNGLFLVHLGWGDEVQSDSAQPLGLLSETNLAYSLLAAQAVTAPSLTLGGMLQADMQVWGANARVPSIFSSAYPQSGSALALTTADLYTLANVNDWTQLFFTLQGGLNGYPTTLSEAMIDFGNLSKTPFYASVGEMNLPFGVFPGGGLVESTLESSAFESTQLNQLNLGFSLGQLDTSLAFFNGQNSLNDFVYNVQYGHSLGNFSLSGGLGYMNDIRYSGSAIAAAYGTSSSRYTKQSKILKGGEIGAVSLNAALAYPLTASQSLGAAAEWVSTTSSPLFHDQPTGDMQAWSLTGNYNRPIFQKNTSFAIDYSASVHMQMVPIPFAVPVNAVNVNLIGTQDQWLGYVQTELVHNVYVGPEYAWIQLYHGGQTWESTLDVTVYL
ncbi:MAG: LbtU family siderophore porin [Gammaproteobacteria bacterium]|nr:LbtU family siderophore porin [Gammaproteobacteria bacterium]